MLSDRLASARKRVGLSQSQLAAKMGGRYDRTMISHVETGKSGLVGEGLSRAALVLGVSIDYLFGLTDEPAPVSELIKSASMIGSCSPDITWIPQIAAVVGSGKGGDSYDTTAIDRLPFPSRWLQDQQVNPDNCHLVTVEGDLMAPTLPHGCTILVDTDRREPKHDRIFVMRLEVELLGQKVKSLIPMRFDLRTSVFEGQRWEDWYVFNDYGQGPATPLSFYQEAKIIGEVMWVQRFL